MAKTDHERRFMTDYLKIPELARRLDVSEKTARRYIKGGALPSTFIGGAYRVTEEDLEEFLHRAEVKPEGASPKGHGLLSAEWALSLADEGTFQQAITNALSQDLRDLAVDLVGNLQPRLFEDVRSEKPSPEDGRRVRAFARTYSIAEELRRRGEEAPKSYILALRRHMDAMTSPETHHVQESQKTA